MNKSISCTILFICSVHITKLYRNTVCGRRREPLHLREVVHYLKYRKVNDNLFSIMCNAVNLKLYTWCINLCLYIWAYVGMGISMPFQMSYDPQLSALIYKTKIYLLINTFKMISSIIKFREIISSLNCHWVSVYYNVIFTAQPWRKTEAN